MPRKESEPLQTKDWNIPMPFNKHERKVLGQRLNPDIFSPPKVIELYTRVKRKILYKRGKIRAYKIYVSFMLYLLGS